MLSTWLRSAILYVSHVNVSSSLSWSVFHFSTVLAITALFFTTLLAASTLSARLFVPDIAAGSARTFSPTNSHMVVHVTLLSGYCPMTNRYHKPCSHHSHTLSRPQKRKQSCLLSTTVMYFLMIISIGMTLLTRTPTISPLIHGTCPHASSSTKRSVIAETLYPCQNKLSICCFE